MKDNLLRGTLPLLNGIGLIDVTKCVKDQFLYPHTFQWSLALNKLNYDLILKQLNKLDVHKSL